mgnify:CR=1 FL=1
MYKALNFFYFLFFAIFFISCSDSKFAKKKNRNSHLEQASSFDNYLQKGKLDSARIYIDSLYKINPNDKELLTNRGEIYFLLNDFEVAEKSWLSCISIDVNNEACYEKLIGLYCGIYDLMDDNCRDIIHKTFNVNENNDIALFFKSKRFVEKNKIPEAIGLYEKLLKNDTTNLRVLNELAVLYDTNFQAEFYYKKMLELDSSYVAFYGLGMYFQEKELFEKAIDNYKQALTIKQKKEPNYNIGYCYLMMNLVDKAVDSFSNAISIDASYLEAYFARGFSYTKLNKNKLAIEDYKFCLMLEPGFEDARIQLEKLK